MYILYLILIYIPKIVCHNVTYNISNWTPCLNNTKNRILTVCQNNNCIIVDDFDSHILILREKCYEENKILNLFVNHWYLTIIVCILIIFLVKYLFQKACPVFRIHPEI